MEGGKKKRTGMFLCQKQTAIDVKIKINNHYDNRIVAVHFCMKWSPQHA